VSPQTKWTKKGHAADRLKQKSPEEQDRQDDRNSDNDDLYETHVFEPQTRWRTELFTSEGCILSVHCEKCQRFGQKWPAARLILPEQQNFRRMAGRQSSEFCRDCDGSRPGEYKNSPRRRRGGAEKARRV
jgi:hypothetical protein